MLKSITLCKSLITAGLVVGATLGVTAPAYAAYPAHMEGDLIKICTAIRDNRIGRLQMAVRHSGLSYRQLQKGLVCNGDDMLTFAAKHKAAATGQLLTRRLGIRQTLTASR
ncbi:DUF3718 domain-containing protein [Salinimonas marina]|uniref:DUF3718 domain-containing protein n=1 Tax=Salinimonas marina TaxID=2785918 RepID=A0A7S9DWL5_9ALTE|nr:DUF3718 domain-containing protein [Salinimonas marina]QPG05073.1 DUF3718 domain-containing protein [Salinimonas marina]